jgi:hypothetical protein
MKKLLVAAIALLIASPAFAAVQNVKVSGDIQITALDRQDFGLGGVRASVGEPGGLVHQTGVAEQTRVRIDADLTDNVSTTVRLINETAWGLNANDGAGSLKAVDLDLAYVTLREFLYSPLTVTVGRQEFYFGNGLIIGGGPNNGTSGHYNGIANDLSLIDSNDGVKAVLDYKPLTLTAIYFKNSQNAGSLVGKYQSSNDSDSSDVYGLNANYQLGDAYNTVVEAYMFSEINGSNITTQAGGTDVKGNKIYVPGLRASTNPVKGLNVQGEVAWQFGNQVVANGGGQSESERRGAMAAQLMATYSLPVMEKYKPTVSASYTYVSGDKDSLANANDSASKTAKVYRAWDPMFEAQGAGTIYNSLFNLTDMTILALGASISPLQDVTAAFTWSGLNSAAKYNGQNSLALLQPDAVGSSVLYTPAGSKKTGLGNESDVNFSYAYTEDVSFGLSLGWFVPGDVFKVDTRSGGHTSVMDKTASQAIADIAVKF